MRTGLRGHRSSLAGLSVVVLLSLACSVGPKTITRDPFNYDGDMASKKVFGFLQIVLSLAETGEGGRGPLVSISQ